MTNNLLIQIINICRNKLPQHPQFENFPHWSFLIRDNQILCCGTNKAHEPEKKYGYHDKERDKGFKPKWHSELDVIKKNKRGFQDVEIANVRLNKLGELRLAIPCKICRNLVNILGIDKVYFTHENGWGNL